MKTIVAVLLLVTLASDVAFAYRWNSGSLPLGYGLLSKPAIKIITVAQPPPPPSVDPVEPPTPYEMGYQIVDPEGNVQGRKEVGDAAGNKVGSYNIALVDGRNRIVTYVADGNGFKAIVKSNEPGTDPSQDPADVIREPLPGAVVKKVIVPAPTTIIKNVPIGPLGYGSLGYGLGPIGPLGGRGLRLGLLGRGLGLGYRGLW